VKLAAAAAVLAALAACGQRDQGPPLDQEWKKVVELSRPRIPAADATLLKDAMESVQSRRDSLRQALEAAATGQRPELSAEDTANIDALVSWYEERGGLPARTCLDLVEGGQHGLAAVTLAELALATAPPDARPARAEAVLYLAHRFREEGVNLLDVTIGSQIGDKAIRWATENGVAPTVAFRDFAPAPHFLARSLAAEAQCMVELARQPGEVRLASAELDGLRRFYLSAIAAVERGGGDEAVVVRLRELTEKAHADRGSPTLKVLVPALGNSAERLLEQRRRYHAFLRGIR
jgi:hypothetical protein